MIVFTACMLATISDYTFMQNSPRQSVDETIVDNNRAFSVQLSGFAINTCSTDNLLKFAIAACLIRADL